MNMDQMRRCLTQARLRCLILEADRDAERAAREAEEVRASRYCYILRSLVGELYPDGEVVDEEDTDYGDMREDDSYADVTSEEDIGDGVVDEDDTYDNVKGEEDSGGDVGYHPQPPGVHLNASACSTSPIVRHIQIHLV